MDTRRHTDMEDVTFTEEGAVVLLRRSKTDQEGEGRKIGIPFGSTPQTCPVRSLRAWLEASGVMSGPLFQYVDRWGHVRPNRRLAPNAVGYIVKKHAELAGLDPASYAGHSLRAGLATQAALNGVPERAIQNQTGHKSLTMLRRYIRDGSLFRENAAAHLGL